MSFQIKAIFLEGADFSNYAVRNEENLANLSRINIFVGANNSGKSRFLRSLASIKQLHFVPTSSLEALETIRRELVSSIVAVANRHSVEDVDGFISKARSLPEMTSVKEREAFAEPLLSLIKGILQHPGRARVSYRSGLGLSSPPEQVLRNLQAAARQASEGLGSASAGLPGKFDFKRIYIPTLRGLRSIGEKDHYQERTRADYLAESNHVEIFTGLALYEEIRKLLLGDLSQRNTVTEFQNFLSREFFENQSVALIPRFEKDVLDVKIGDEKQRPIYELGDGVQSIIILTFPLYQYRDKDILVFIEEPELFMHPGLQRLLVNVLCQFPKAQYFLATHSNHLLDLTLDVEQMAVFTFRKKLEGEGQLEKNAHVTIENVSNGDERSLQLLGIRNSSVFLSNCTLWVEGITDRRYISHYLDLYQDHLRNEAESNGMEVPKRYRQDLHYSFVEYAGANITHFSFLESEADPIVVDRLCGKLCLVADKDEDKQARHAALKEKLGDRYFCLPCREIENLLTPEVVSAVVESYEGANTKLNSFNQSDYTDESLGRFIEDKVVASKRKRRASYAAKSGTISDKITFCQKALEKIRRFEDLSPNAQSLTKKIYAFIESKNA